jgi:hypothetical protein
MIVIVDDEVGGLQRRFRVAPPVDPVIGGKAPFSPNMPILSNGRPRRASMGRQNGFLGGSDHGSSRPSTSYSIRTGGGGASLESFAI